MWGIPTILGLSPVAEPSSDVYFLKQIFTDAATESSIVIWMF